MYIAPTTQEVYWLVDAFIYDINGMKKRRIHCNILLIVEDQEPSSLPEYPLEGLFSFLQLQ